MDAITEFLKTLNGLSPLAVISLLGTVIFYQVKNSKNSEASFDTLANNHLHELPTILDTLQRMETANATAFATIIAKLNGGFHK